MNLSMVPQPARLRYPFSRLPMVETVSKRGCPYPIVLVMGPNGKRKLRLTPTDARALGEALLRHAEKARAA